MPAGKTQLAAGRWIWALPAIGIRRVLSRGIVMIPLAGFTMPVSGEEDPEEENCTADTH